jgi:hypothetical protein
VRRVALYGLGWVAAAVLAVFVSWQGVSRVGTEVTNRHPRPLTTEEARQALARPPAAVPDAGQPGGGQPGAGPAAPPTTATTARRPTATTAPTRQPGPAVIPTTRPAGPAPGPGPSPAPGPAGSSAPAPGEVTRTYNLVGGSATLRFSPSGVTVLWADPRAGFRVEVDNRSDGGVRVRFESETHRSELEAWWDGGPRDRVQEEGSGGGSGGG